MQLPAASSSLLIKGGLIMTNYAIANMIFDCSNGLQVHCQVHDVTSEHELFVPNW